MLGVMVALYRVLDQEPRLEQRRQASARHAIEQWIANEQAARELADAPPTTGTNHRATGLRAPCRTHAGRKATPRDHARCQRSPSPIHIVRVVPCHRHTTARE